VLVVKVALEEGSSINVCCRVPSPLEYHVFVAFQANDTGDDGSPVEIILAVKFWHVNGKFLSVLVDV